MAHGRHCRSWRKLAGWTGSYFRAQLLFTWPTLGDEDYLTAVGIQNRPPLWQKLLAEQSNRNRRNKRALLRTNTDTYAHRGLPQRVANRREVATRKLTFDVARTSGRKAAPPNSRRGGRALRWQPSQCKRQRRPPSRPQRLCSNQRHCSPPCTDRSPDRHAPI